MIYHYYPFLYIAAASRRVAASQAALCHHLPAARQNCKKWSANACRSGGTAAKRAAFAPAFGVTRGTAACGEARGRGVAPEERGVAARRGGRGVTLRARGVAGLRARHGDADAFLGRVGARAGGRREARRAACARRRPTARRAPKARKRPPPTRRAAREAAAVQAQRRLRYRGEPASPRLG